MWKEASAAAGQGVEGLAEGLAIDDVVHVGRSWFRMSGPAATSAEAEADDDGVARPISVTKTARLGEIVLPPEVIMGRSLFDTALSTPAPREQEASVAQPRGTVTVSWWGLAILGASLLLTGAAVAVMALRARPAPVVAAPAAVPAPAPIAAAPVAPAPAAPAPAVVPAPETPVAAAPAVLPARPQAPVIVERSVAAPPSPPPSEAVAAVAPVTAPTPATRAIVRRPAAVSAQRLRTAPAAAPAPAPKHETPATQPDPWATPAPKKPTWVDPFAE
jgi:hypothetical protein